MELLVLPALTDDLEQVVPVSESGNPNLGETVTERRRQLLLTEVTTGVHGRDNVEARVGDNGRIVDVDTALLGEHERASRLENGVETLKH